MSDQKPDLFDLTSGNEVRRWYWRKDQLIPFAKHLGLKTTGGKFEVLDRIAHFLDTGEKTAPGDKKLRTTSKFDWHSETLTDETVITDSYKNSQNVRRYFKSRVGDSFKFNIAMMDWMRDNIGRTLADACDAYHAIKAQEKVPGYQTKIRGHNQFNQYTRDFLADNPELGVADVRRVWSLKIQQPSEDGRHIYVRSDLQL